MTAPVLLRAEGSDRVAIRPLGYLGDRFRDYLRAISGGRFDPEKKEHVLAIDKASAVVRRLRSEGFAVEIDDQAQRSLDTFEAERWVDLEGARDRLRLLERELSTQIDKRTNKPMALYPFQRHGVEWLSTRFGGLLGDEMGLGKTVSTLCAIPAGAPVLVICPAVMKHTWIEETKRWRPSLRASMLSGQDAFRWPEPGELLAINYDVLPRVHLESCKRFKTWECPGCHPTDRSVHKAGCKISTKTWCRGCASDLGLPHEGTVVVGDEIHVCRNQDTLRSEATRAIVRKARERGGRSYILSGTPVQNRPEEMWNVLDIADLAREAFGTWGRFVKLFGGTPKTIETYDRKEKRRTVKRAGYSWSGVVEPEAADLLQRVMLRRLRKDVLPDLPKATFRTFPVEVDKRALKKCDDALQKVGGLGALLELVNKGKHGITEISSVRAILAEAKTPALIKLIESDYEESSEPVVVFSAHRYPVDKLGERPGWEAITGDVSAKRRGEIVEAFQAGALKGVALTIAAGGVGITLTRACFMVFVDLAWSPAENAQARDRIVRIGQERPVLVTNLVARHPLDERVSEILEQKTRLIESSVDAAASIQ